MAEEKKKKKKESVNINLPKARASIKRQHEMGQMKNNYEDAWKALGIILLIGLILFVILGGINQVAFWEFFKTWAERVGNAISNWLDSGNVVQNENGIYYQP